MAIELVEVIFKGRRVDIFANPRKLKINPKDYVIVEADRGEDIGQVERLGSVAYLSEEDQVKNVVRLASSEELEKMNKNRLLEEEAVEICKEKVNKHRLNMNMVDAEWQLDHHRLTFYFTSDNRVDFRELVRDLAGRFKTRIELRQIGVRDAARRLGGCGVCGRELCCSIFLRECESISLQFAKDQLLPTNPSRLTGICGRLKCCLSYERQFYLKELDRYPRLDDRVLTSRGEGTVEKVDIFNERIYLRFDGDEVESFTLEEIEAFRTGDVEETN